MSQFSERDLPPELQGVAERLRAERPELSGMELDEMRRRVRARAPVPSRVATTRRSIMKSRVMVTAVLVLGLLFSTAGAGLAVSGLADQGSAGNAQYRQETPPEALGEIETVQPEEQPQAAPTPQAAPEQPRQLSVPQESALPFTGFSAIPVLVLGIALLAAGLVLRRRSRDDAAG